MVRVKLDNRIRVLIENGVAKKHRSFFIIVGDKGRDQVGTYHRSNKFIYLIKGNPEASPCTLLL